MSEHGRLRTAVEAMAEVRRHATFLARPAVSPSRPEIEREWETIQLRKAFAALDLRVHDDLSVTGCRRNAPEGS